MDSLNEKCSRRLAWAVILSLSSFGIAVPAVRADVNISAKPTQNMSCSAGVCAPTARNAVLNANDVVSMLNAGDLTVLTGSGANNIVVRAGFSWASASRLTLDAIQSVEIEKPVTVAGSGAVTIMTNEGGTGGDLLFAGAGSISFWDLASSLVINGNSYVLVRRLKTLVTDVKQNSGGFFALAGNDNAQKYGPYARSPISAFTGTIEGLGHIINNLSIGNSDKEHPLGLIYQNFGTVRDLGLTNVRMANRYADPAGGIAATNSGTIHNSFVTGSVAGYVAGGLVGDNEGTISHSHANVIVAGSSYGGGVAGVNGSLIETSYAEGSVTALFGGGLIGRNNGTVAQSYATASLPCGNPNYCGGLIGENLGVVANSYATGPVVAGYGGGLLGDSVAPAITATYSTGEVSAFVAGGLVSVDGAETFSDSYWDLETSGVSEPSQGAGDPPNDPGITGLNTAQFQSGLPQDFDPTIWGENPAINGGYPYLLAVPPR
jgi:hypothetical protein